MSTTLAVWTFFGALSLIFPIFLNLSVFIDVFNKKGSFAIYVFKFIKIYGGYITLYDKGIAIHLTKKKAILLPFTEFVDAPNRFKVTKGFQLYALHQIIEIGGENAFAVISSSAIQSILCSIFSIIENKHKFMSLKCNSIFYQNEKTIKYSAKLVAIFNVLVVMIAISKIILEEILNNVKNRKKQKSNRNS